VLTRAEREHHLVAREHCAHWIHATRERLAEDEEVRLHVLVVTGEHLARAAQARLHLVGDHQHVVSCAQLAHASEVPLVRHHHARLALDGSRESNALW
jgi:hypothetical protein